MIHELDRLAKHFQHVEWIWDDGKTQIAYYCDTTLQGCLGSRYLVRFKPKGRWKVRHALECSDLLKHTCHFCGRRGKKGFIAEIYISELIDTTRACIGCRSRYSALSRKIYEAEQLAKQARKHLREIKGLINESTENNARTA